MAFLIKDHGRIYRKRVSFDNITNVSPSFTLKRTSQGFKKRNSTRTYMVALDLNNELVCGLDFTLRNLIDEGDEIIVVGVYASNQSVFEISASKKAQEIMEWITESHQGDAISITVELTFDRPDIALGTMVKMYTPSLLILGTHRKSVVKNHFSGTGVFKPTLKKEKIPFVVVKDSFQYKKESKINCCCIIF